MASRSEFMAIATMTAHNVALAIDQVAEGESADLFTLGHDFPDEFMADNKGRLDRGPGPRIPLVDVHVGAADGRAFDANQYVGRTGLGHRSFDEVEAGGGSPLGQCAHRGRNHYSGTNKVRQLHRRFK